MLHGVMVHLSLEMADLLLTSPKDTNDKYKF